MSPTSSGRALITGGAGAIGSRLAERLLAHGWDVTVLDDFSSGFRDNLAAGCRLVEGSLVDRSALTAALGGEGYDLVFHLAALFANQNSVEHPERDLEVNALGTLRLAESLEAIPWRARLRRLIFSSSSCVYGAFDGSAQESGPFLPETPYAITKLMGEHYLRYFHERAALPVTVLRLFNSYGPGERPGRYRNVVPNFIALALRGEPLTITGTGRETRDFTYVDDVIDCFTAAALSPAAAGAVLNVGTGSATEVGLLAREIVRLTGSRSEIRYAPRRAWDTVAHRRADVTRARDLLGYAPRVALGEGLARTIAWLRGLGEHGR